DRGALRWLLAHPGALAHRTPRVLAWLLQTYGRAALPDLVAALERGIRSPRLEKAVIEALGVEHHRPARAAIERGLDPAETEVLIAAVRALGELQEVDSASALMGALKDPEWAVRAQAARALGRVSAPIAIHSLAHGLTDSSWWVRRHAAYALVELG